jgi:hypothetical protein
MTGEDNPEYSCSWCNRLLIRLSDRNNQSESWFCRNCQIPFEPSETQIRKKSKLGTRREEVELHSKIRGRPFYGWFLEKHRAASKPTSENYGRCCFNHIIGLPKKNGKEYELFDYEFMVYKALMIDTYLNARPPTPEEEEEHFMKLKIEVEGQKTQTDIYR